MDTKDICFCMESFIDISFLVLEILREGRVMCSPLSIHKPNKAFGKIQLFLQHQLFTFFYSIYSIYKGMETKRDGDHEF